ncbi:MAG: hypothetical protein Q9159_002984 [Coniocarpon cinnabarinum]
MYKFMAIAEMRKEPTPGQTERSARSSDAVGRLSDSQAVDSAKKRLNVDSPSFTPAVPNTSGPANKASGFSPRAASAAPFQPKNAKSDVHHQSTFIANMHISAHEALATPPVISRHQSSEWSNPGIPEFVPQGFHQENGVIGEPAPQLTLTEPYHPFDASGSYADANASQQTTSTFNPYAQEASAPNGATIYNQQNAFTQPVRTASHTAHCLRSPCQLNYHLYAPVGPHRENLLAYQRTAHDFFISESLRQDLTRKAELTLQEFPNASLPPAVEHFHSLVPLDTVSQKSSNVFGYSTWLYKVMSSQDGNYYTLRRIAGFRLTTEKAVSTIPAWKRIANASCVTVHDCFTTRAFGDSSLVFVTDYHPMSKTLAEAHLLQQHSRSSRSSQVPEHVIWSYIVQLTSALRTIHANNLAARLITPSKVLLTSKNRVRLNATGVLDVTQYSNDPPSLEYLQIDDLRQLGRLVLALATLNPAHATSQPAGKGQFQTGVQPATVKVLEALSRSYSERFCAVVATLIDAGNPSNPDAIQDAFSFASSITDHVLSNMDSALHSEDALTSNLVRELENGRLVRLMSKLGCINERPEYSPHDPNSATINASSPASLQRAAWSETGERYYLKLFRDYVFHQVAAEDGRPVVDLGHVITCLNKLDAGSDEKIALVTRDEQNVIVVSYREVKRGLESAFLELRTAAQGTSGAGINTGIGMMARR